MGKRGPKPQPLALRIAKGNPGGRPLNIHEPKPDRAGTTPPKWLAAESKIVWKEIVDALDVCGILKKTDIHALALACDAIARYRVYLEACRAGLDIMEMHHDDGSVKYRQVAPSASLCMKWQAAAMRALCEFGMTPSARSGIVGGDGKDADPLTAFIRKQG